MPQRSTPARYMLDGQRFERWCFKTAINMATSGNVRGLVEKWEPPDAVVRSVVEGQPLPDGCGVGLEAGFGDFLADRDQIQFQALPCP